MDDPLIVSVSGLRGVMGSSLTVEVASRYAAALAAGLPQGRAAEAREDLRDVRPRV